MCANTEDGRWECVTCDEGFRSESDITEHVQQEHTFEHCVCAECNVVFMDERALRTHEAGVHGNASRGGGGDGPDWTTVQNVDVNDSDVDITDADVNDVKTLPDVDVSWLQDVLDMSAEGGSEDGPCEGATRGVGAQEHSAHAQTAHHGKAQQHLCDTCGKTFARITSLQRHARVCGKGKKSVYVCHVCAAVFQSRRSLLGHRRTAHEKQPEPGRAALTPPGKENVGNPAEVDSAGEDVSATLDGDGLNRIYAAGDGAEMDCDDVTAGRARLKDACADENAKPFECTICNRKYGSKASLRGHVRSHASGPFPCPSCAKTFASKATLRSHVRGAHEGTMLKCDRCDSSFQEEKSLKIHVKIQHEKQFPFQCEICGKGMWDKARYDGHMNFHYGRKPYECGFCGRQYTTSGTLQRHILQVCGRNKSVQCEHCAKEFTCDAYLKDHVKLVHERKTSFLCDLCGTEFTRKSSLDRHVAARCKWDAAGPAARTPGAGGSSAAAEAQAPPGTPQASVLLGISLV